MASVIIVPSPSGVTEATGWLGVLEAVLVLLLFEGAAGPPTDAAGVLLPAGADVVELPLIVVGNKAPPKAAVALPAPAT